MRVVSSDFDTFSVQCLFVRDGELRAMVSGTECRVLSKESLLAIGVVMCQPADPRLVANWPISCVLEVDGVEQRFASFTTEPQLVAAARRFFQAQVDGVDPASLSF